MKIIIKTKNLELTESLRNYIEEKMGGLARFAKKLPDIFVEVEKETMHHRHGDVFKAEAQIIFPGKSIVAQANGSDLFLAIVEVKDELQQEIKKYKTKKIDSRRKGGLKAKTQLKSEIS